MEVWLTGTGGLVAIMVWCSDCRGRVVWWQQSRCCYCLVWFVCVCVCVCVWYMVIEVWYF